MEKRKTAMSDLVHLTLPSPDPEPVEGCAGCVELANVRDRARAGGDLTTVSDCNVFLRRHPQGHS
ncbi:hypothetical protein [Streptomyces sp. NPDC050848]|uniref:hypothetical protein n=1 Tax=Streptomyces sp. NPDC050848 TaxID=3155791 RepID=UPI0033E19DF1